MLVGKEGLHWPLKKEIIVKGRGGQKLIRTFCRLYLQLMVSFLFRGVGGLRKSFLPFSSDVELYKRPLNCLHIIRDGISVIGYIG